MNLISITFENKYFKIVEDKNYGKKAGVRRGTLAGACRAGVHLHGQGRVYMAL